MYREKHKTNTTMNKFAFDLIDAVDYFGSKERVSFSGKWAYIYAGKDAVFSLQLDQIEPTMILHVYDDCEILLYNID